MLVPSSRFGCRHKSKKNGTGAGVEEPASPPPASPNPAQILRSMGFPTPVSFAHRLKDWAEAHRWSFTTMTKAAVLLDGDPDALQLESSTPPLMVYTISPAQSAYPTPANTFRIESIGLMRSEQLHTISGCPSLQKAWEEGEAGRKEMAASFRQDGDPAFAGVIPVVYRLKDTDMVVHNQHPVWRARRKPDERTHALLLDVLTVCKGSVNAGTSMRPPDGYSHIPVPGTMVHSKKTWLWTPLHPAGLDMWDYTALSLPNIYRVKTGLSPTAIFRRFAEL